MQADKAKPLEQQLRYRNALVGLYRVRRAPHAPRALTLTLM
jgi:hypothetical protein